MKRAYFRFIQSEIFVLNLIKEGCDELLIDSDTSCGAQVFNLIMKFVCLLPNLLLTSSMGVLSRKWNGRSGLKLFVTATKAKTNLEVLS